MTHYDALSFMGFGIPSNGGEGTGTYKETASLCVMRHTFLAISDARPLFRRLILTFNSPQMTHFVRHVRHRRPPPFHITKKRT